MLTEKVEIGVGGRPASGLGRLPVQTNERCVEAVHDLRDLWPGGTVGRQSGDQLMRVVKQLRRPVTASIPAAAGRGGSGGGAGEAGSGGGTAARDGRGRHAAEPR